MRRASINNSHFRLKGQLCAKSSYKLCTIKPFRGGYSKWNFVFLKFIYFDVFFLTFFFQVPANGSWSGWSGFGACSKTCGGGVQNRTRSCTNPPPSNGGVPCQGLAIDCQRCAAIRCPSKEHIQTISTHIIKTNFKPSAFLPRCFRFLLYNAENTLLVLRFMEVREDRTGNSSVQNAGRHPSSLICEPMLRAQYKSLLKKEKAKSSMMNVLGVW